MSAQQRLARDLGESAATIDVSALYFDSEQDAAATAAAASSTVATAGSSVNGVIVTRSAESIGKEVPVRSAVVHSNPRVDLLWPDRYTLSSGRWPSGTNEVAISDTLRSDTATLRDTVGSAQVVGTVSDRYVQERAFAVTDGSIPVEQSPLGAGRTESTSIQLLLSRPLSEEAVATLTDSIMEPDQPWASGLQSIASSSGVTESAAAEEITAQLAGSIIDRDAILLSQSGSYSTSLITYAYGVGVWLLSILAGATTAGLARRYRRRTVSTLEQIGVSKRVALLSVGLSTLVHAIASTLFGVALGLFAASAVRWVLPNFVTQPLSPFNWGDGAISSVLVGTGLGLLSGFLVLPWLEGRHGRDQFKKAKATKETNPGTILVCLLALCGGLIAFILTDSLLLPVVLSPLLAFVLGVGGLVLLKGVVSDAPGRSLGWTLAARRMRSEQASVKSVVLVLATLLVLPLSASVANDAIETTLEEQSTSLVPPRQVIVEPALSRVSDGRPSIEVMSDSVGLGPSIIYYRFASTLETRVSTFADGVGAVLVVDSVTDARELMEGSLSGRHLNALEEGALLVDANANPPFKTSGLYVANEDEAAVRVDEIPTLQATFQKNWAVSIDGLILASALKAGGVPLPSTSTAAALLPVSPQQRETGLRAVAEAGGNLSQVYIFEIDIPGLPRAFTFALWALLLLACSILGVAASTEQKHLRSYTARLAAVGLPETMLRRALLCRLAVVLGTSLVASLVATIVVTVLLASTGGLRPSGAALLDISWIVALLLLSCFVGSAVGRRSSAVTS